MRPHLQKEILRYIEEVPLDPPARYDGDEAFNRLALTLFAFQYQNNPLYRRLCQARDTRPGDILSWRHIPAVAASSFKFADFYCGEPSEARWVFHSSGTTKRVPGKHFFRTVEIYRRAALRVFRWACLPDREKIPTLVIGPTAPYFRHSSLGHMFSWIQHAFGEEPSLVAFGPDGLDLEAALDWLHRAAVVATPVMILGTSLGLLALCESPQLQRAKIRLAAGSRVIDTGGYKGTARAISRPEFEACVAEALGLLPEWIFNEYGMTELSSQFYESRFLEKPFGGRGKIAPPWLRPIVCDPVSLEPLPEGESGALRFLDLANLDSVCMIQTEDFGRLEGDRLILFGRAPGAPPRGCSLLAEEIIGLSERTQ